MRTLLIFSCLSAATALSACGRVEPAKPAPAAMSSGQLSTELERCKQLGLKVYDDAACQAAQRERNDRFFKKSTEPGK
jgi:conjugative transfer region protein TrbK